MVDVEVPAQLVVIGASAGGVEALSTLVSTLPDAFSAPIIIAQHLDPSRLSHLQEILARRSRVPVRTVHDRDQLQNGVVYVVPADRQVEVSDHSVLVHSGQGLSRPAPSINRLLASAAEAFGEQLVAVILTGLGSDGADGARRVKEQGGTVVIQNPQTAAHPEMPLSLAPTTVDIVAELEAIGPLLGELLSGTYAPIEPDDDRRMRSVLDQVRARSGIDFSAYKEPTIRRRLQRRMLDTNSNTLEDYLRHIRRHPEEVERLANSFLIKVTDFFRDEDLFAYLRRQVLPQLIDEARERDHELRLWSAGCATGEEAYSLAIEVSDLLGDELPEFTVRTFATDLDGGAVAFARRGVYPASALKNVSKERRERYLSRIDSAWEVRKQLRSMVIFGQHDLGQRAPFPRIDLVLCRNVLIYFTPELQRRALQLFAFALREGGYLVLGKAESTSPLPEYFTITNPSLRVFRRHGERVLIPASSTRGGSTASLPLAAIGRPAQEHDLTRSGVRQLSGPTASERAEQVLLGLPVGVVLVDRKYDIQSINAVARRLLGVHTPAIGEDVIHLAHRALGGALRDALEGAIKGQQRSTVHELTDLPETPGQTRYFEVTAFLQRTPSERAQPAEGIVIWIADVTDRERQLREVAAALSDVQGRADHLQQLLDASTAKVRDLLDANADLAASNASLLSGNEELLVGSEEAQAAMEEIETLNEEQQATNEELETLNEELQATVEELNATNEDLQARSLEMQEQAAAREALMSTLNQERQRLDAILTSMSDAVMVVNADAQPVLTNAAFKQSFGDALPPVEDAAGQRLSPDANPVAMASRGETFSVPFTRPDGAGLRRMYEAKGQPIQLGDVTGGVVVIRDVTDHNLRALQEQFVAVASHELRNPLTALHGSLQLLDRTLDDASDTKLRQYLKIAHTQIQLLEALVEDLSDVVRVQAGQQLVSSQQLDLVELAHSAVDIARTMGEGQEIRLAVPADALRIAGDRRRLQQVLLNLIANALQHGASPRGVDVRVLRDTQYGIVEVSDYGPGIPPDEREHIFERFYQASRGGTGLGVGLYLVREIVSAHRGTVDADSGADHGTTFIVRLPLAG